jgi:hypothetical protein
VSLNKSQVNKYTKLKLNFDFVVNCSRFVDNIKYRSHEDVQLLFETFFSIMNI